jgi:hypothetical protein
MKPNDFTRMDRRSALKWVGAALVAFPLLDFKTLAEYPAGLKETLSDPNLFHPGRLWGRELTAEELKTAASLADVIIPADDQSPSASQVGIGDFLDEWVSAPYPVQQADLKLVREGLRWMNTEANKRFQKDFADLDDAQKAKICDDICYLPKATEEFKGAAVFFARMRDLTASGFYTTDAGFRDLRYIGNIPLTKFKGPPPNVLEYLKLA